MSSIYENGVLCFHSLHGVAMGVIPGSTVHALHVSLILCCEQRELVDYVRWGDGGWDPVLGVICSQAIGCDPMMFHY